MRGRTAGALNIKHPRTVSQERVAIRRMLTIVKGLEKEVNAILREDAQRRRNRAATTKKPGGGK